MAINQIILVGHLSKDPELKQTKTGKKVVSFTLAVNKRGKDAGTNFIDCVAWERAAELINQYLTKGSQVAVVGRLDQQSWKTPEGMNRSRLLVIADDITFLGGARKAKQEGQDVLPTEAEVAMDISPDSIPF